MTHIPTPAEIETLRKIVNGELDREVDYAAIIAANKTLNRLSPPEPEQPDEATVWTRKVLEVFGLVNEDDPYFQDSRQVLSELIADKDAEIARLTAEIASLREYIVTAERKPAEPAISLADAECGMPKIDTAPVVEVTQGDRDAAQEITKSLCEWLSAKGVRASYENNGDDEIVRAFAHHRTEAEACGRREAFSNASLLVADAVDNAGDEGELRMAQAIFDELKRMMTGGK